MRQKKSFFRQNLNLPFDDAIVEEDSPSDKVFAPMSLRLVVNTSYRQVVESTSFDVQLLTMSLNRLVFLCDATRSSRNGGSDAELGL